ncbi:MAG: 4Fe-4S binding protein, partial [Fervidobacterium sp.]
EERCITCGHCVKVCSQNAKSVLSDKDIVVNNYLINHKTFAIIAPSFPASFRILIISCFWGISSTM